MAGFRRYSTAVMLVLTLGICSSAVAGTPYRKLSAFSKVLSLIERYYVDEPDESALMEGAIFGLLRALDPHSSYLTTKEYRTLLEDTEGRFFGVGLEVSFRNKQLTVIAPMANSPAARAGIAPGDVITHIGDRPTDTMDIQDAVMAMRGARGTKVSITILRVGKKPFKKTLVRGPIELARVEVSRLSEKVVLVRLKSFVEESAHKMESALKEASKEAPIGGVVLDLRQNPGGLLTEAVGVGDLFLADGTIVTTRGKRKNDETHYLAHRRGTLAPWPMVVLIDESTASAAEIVAGALQDNGRAVLVGMRSFGKGSVQTIIPLGDGSALKLTTARYYTPSGRSIQARGIEPDVVVPTRVVPDADNALFGGVDGFSEQSLDGHLAAEGRRGRGSLDVVEDFQLRVAAQLVTGLMGLKRGQRR